MNWQILKNVLVLFLGILLLAVVAAFLVFATVEYGHRGAEFVGCYVYDAMLIGFECQGFSGSFNSSCMAKLASLDNCCANVCNFQLKGIYSCCVGLVANSYLHYFAG